MFFFSSKCRRPTSSVSRGTKRCAVEASNRCLSDNGGERPRSERPGTQRPRAEQLRAGTTD